VTGDEIVVRRNPDYFGAKAHLERIVFKYAPDPTVRTQLCGAVTSTWWRSSRPRSGGGLTDDPEIAARFWRLKHVPATSSGSGGTRNDRCSWIGECAAP